MRQPTKLTTPLLLLLAFTAPCAADTPATQPDPAADRLTFLTLQLSSTEASLTALATALRNAGYKSVVSSNTAQFYAHNNQELDINGGGPVPWDKFYAKTAKGFAPRNILGVPQNYQRPNQFNYIYKANNDQIEKANSEVAALGKKIDVLIARRRKLEAEQSALWATISWESFQNHDVSVNPVYRYQLKALNAIPAADARRDVLRPAIHFLRTIDKNVSDQLDTLHTNQTQSLTDLADRTQSAYATAKESITTAMLSADLSPEDLKTGKDLLASMKRISDLSKNITEAYRLALDGDTANDDSRKLTFRAQLQAALLDYSAAASDFDDQLTRLAKTWELVPEKAVANPDVVPTTKITKAIETITPAHIDQSTPPQSAASDIPVKIDLITIVDPIKDAVRGTWAVRDGKLICRAGGDVRIGFAYFPPPEYDLRLVLCITDGRNSDIYIAAADSQGPFVWGYGMGNKYSGFSNVDGHDGSDTRNPTTKETGLIKHDQWYTLVIKVRQNSIQAFVNDSLISEIDLSKIKIKPFPRMSLPKECYIGIMANDSELNISNAEVTEITGHGKVLRETK